MYLRFKNLFSIKGYHLFILCMILLGVAISISMPFLSLFATDDFGMSTGAFGIFMAVTSISGVFVNSFIAKRSDNDLDRKLIIIIAMVSSAFGYASYLFFHNFFILLIAVTFFNGFGAAAMPQIYAYAQESASESNLDDMTLAMSTLRSLFSLGFLLGPLGGTLIFRFFGYNGLFIGTAIIFLAIAMLVVLFLKSRKTIPLKPKRINVGNTSSLKNKTIRYPFIAFILLLAINSINGINTPLFIVNELHGNYTDVGIVVSISAGIEIPIMITLGGLARKISNHTLMISGCFISAIYYIVLSISTDPWQLIAAQILQATYVAIVMGNGLSYFTDLLPDSPGVSTTIYSNASTIGRLVGSLGAGFIAQIIGFRGVYWVCLLMLAVSFLILWKTRPKQGLNVSIEHTPSA